MTALDVTVFYLNALEQGPQPLTISLKDKWICLVYILAENYLVKT